MTTGEGAAVEGLAARTGLDAGKLRRLLRTLVAHHVFVEVEHGRFAHNEASTVLAQDAGVRDWVLTSAMQFPAATHLPAVLRDERLGPSYSPADTAFARVHRTRGPFFAWLAGAEGRPRSPPPSSSSSSSPPRVGGMTVESEAPRIGARSWRDVFNVAMGGLSDTFYAGLEHDYPWGRVGEDGTGLVVDVGGGIGTSALQLHRLYPRLRLVVQDLPAMMAQAERYWAIEAPDALASGQARLMEQDFFDANAVVGAHVYWVRSVCHDWSDAQLAQILGNLAKAMGPHSRLLLGEMVMPTSCGDTAPAPVFASVFAHLADMAMMAVTNGQERTLAEYDAVVSAAGLRVVKVWPCRGLASVIECRKAAAAAAAAAA